MRYEEMWREENKKYLLDLEGPCRRAAGIIRRLDPSVIAENKLICGRSIGGCSNSDRSITRLSCPSWLHSRQTISPSRAIKSSSSVYFSLLQNLLWHPNPPLISLSSTHLWLSIYPTRRNSYALSWLHVLYLLPYLLQCAHYYFLLPRARYNNAMISPKMQLKALFNNVFTLTKSELHFPIHAILW